MANEEFQKLAARVKAVEETLSKEPMPTLADIDRMQRELLAVINTLDQWLLPPDPYADTRLRPGLTRMERDLATTMFDADGPTGPVEGDQHG